MTREPFALRSLFLEPFLPKGKSEGGVWLVNAQGDSLHDRRLIPIYGKVTATHPTCRYVRVNDFVIFAPNRPVELKLPHETLYWIMETELLGVVEAGDQWPWFEPEDTSIGSPVASAV